MGLDRKKQGVCAPMPLLATYVVKTDLYWSPRCVDRLLQTVGINDRSPNSWGLYLCAKLGPGAPWYPPPLTLDTQTAWRYVWLPRRSRWLKAPATDVPFAVTTRHNDVKHPEVIRDAAGRGVAPPYGQKGNNQLPRASWWERWKGPPPLPGRH